MKKLNIFKISFAGLMIASFAACGSHGPSSVLSPFSDGSTAELGVRSNQPLLNEGGGSVGEERARTALNVMGQYRRAQPAQPGMPVIQPAEVRLMWIPDHLNKHGDLVPQHYYYLKVLSDRWEVQDAFDIERQLDEGSGGAGNGSSIPFIYKRK